MSISSSQDMYDLGVHDAEIDDLNIFYYQHYYHYRRGYDVTRRRLRQATHFQHFGRSWILVFLGIVAVGAVGVALLLSGPDNQENRSRAANAIPTRAPAIIPTVAPRTMTPTVVLEPTLPPAAPVLAVGGQAQVVNVGDTPLLARASAGVNAPVVTEFAEGTQVALLEGPVELDGYTWWRIESNGNMGWSAERSTNGVIWLRPLP
ncbi:MAG: hypothetical protein HC837_13110 [Chloroflexaceae bacterium]|nr:hypothetical protein [Chloroflexaceae bacterium]